MTAPPVSPKVTSPWPYVVAFISFLVITLAAWAILVFAPSSQSDHAISKIGAGVSLILADPRGAANAIIAVLTTIATVYAAARALYHTTPAATSSSSTSSGSSTSGFVTPSLLGTLALAGFFALAAAALLSGCGPSAFRTHATLSHTIHRALEVTGGDDGTMAAATDAGLATCPHDDGDARTRCIDEIEHIALGAGAIHDALILPSNAYRAEILGACGIDPADPNAQIPDTCPDPPPALLERIVELGAPIARDAPAFVAALRALGAPIPEGL